jgi:acetyltransferase-like isoleucine patch superfamily enzyme
MSKYFLINSIISKIKKEEFILDEKVPLSYLMNLIFSKVFMYMRGLVRCRKMIMIGKNVVLRAKDSFLFGHSVQISEHCIIDALSTNGITFGNNVSIQKYTIIECTGSIKYLGQGLIIGNNVGIGSNSFLGCAGGIEIGDDTIIGNYVSFHAENHNYSDPEIPIRLQGVNHQGIKVGKNCWIGAKVTVLDGAVIGNGCIIAAGAVVKQGTYEDNSIYGGVPAKFIKKRF